MIEDISMSTWMPKLRIFLEKIITLLAIAKQTKNLGIKKQIVKIFEKDFEKYDEIAQILMDAFEEAKMKKE